MGASGRGLLILPEELTAHALHFVLALLSFQIKPAFVCLFICSIPADMQITYNVQFTHIRRDGHLKNTVWGSHMKFDLSVLLGTNSHLVGYTFKVLLAS